MAQTRKADQETMTLVLRDFPTEIAERIEALGKLDHRKRNEQIFFYLEGITSGRLQVVPTDDQEPQPRRAA